MPPLRLKQIWQNVALATITVCGLIVLGYLSLRLPTACAPLGKGSYSIPVWSPDGAFLAFQFRSSQTSDELWLLEMTTRELHKLNTGGRLTALFGLQWEDAQTLWAVDHLGRTNHLSLISPSDIYRINATSGEPEDVVETVWDLGGFAIHPGRDEIVLSERYDRLNVYSFDTEAGVGALLRQLPIRGRKPMWSPDGMQLAFIGVENQLSTGHLLIERDGLYVDLDLSIVNWASAFGWSPDSQRLLFVGDYRAPGLYVVPNDGRTAPTLILAGSYESVAWSPDGLNIAYTTTGVPGSNELCIVDTETLGLP